MMGYELINSQFITHAQINIVQSFLVATGVKEVVEIEMTKEEKEQFDSSCSHLQSFYKEV